VDNQVIYHGIVSIVDDAISILSRHAGEKFASSVTIRWNPRMRSTAGRAFLLEAKVELNPKLLHLDNDTQQSLSQVRQTLLHELAHLLAHHRHGHRIAYQVNQPLISLTSPHAHKRKNGVTPAHTVLKSFSVFAP